VIGSKLMTASALLITVRLPDGRFHGLPEWPPSPFRLFQALVAGALTGAPRAHADALTPVFGWFEALGPPSIATPPARAAQRSTLWVPNNDLDAVGGDPRRTAEIRTAKRVAPRLIEPDAPFLYVWPLIEGSVGPATSMPALAEQLYQLGRGIDMAYAAAEILTLDAADARLIAHHGTIHRPSQQGQGGKPLRCPTPGSFASLLRRRRVQRMRLRGGHLTQAPPAHFRVVAYDTVPTLLLFDFVRGDEAPRFARIPLTRAAELVERARDRLAWLLDRALGDPGLVERVVTGRGAGEADKSARLRIIPLPSIGSAHADRAIRRVLIEVPPDCPIPAREIEWAAGAVHLGANKDGEIAEPDEPQLVRATDEVMLRHYGIGAEPRPARVWRTVTPAALPVLRPRGRAGGVERKAGEVEAAQALRQALRHAAVAVAVETVSVQPEPLERRGERADGFAVPPRFASRGLHHVEITFREAVRGPLVVGDGRYLGLGLMAPVPDVWRDVMVFRLPQGAEVAATDAPLLLQAVRRALMALSRDPRGGVPRLFSGHESDGAPARSGRHEHVFLAADDGDGDGCLDRLLVAAPWACDRTVKGSRDDRRRFDEVASALEEVRAGRLGVLRLHLLPSIFLENHPLLGPGQVWESRTLYRATRHGRRRAHPAATVAIDLALECLRRGLPRPEVEVLEVEAGPQGGRVMARGRLHFAAAVSGPILLGRDSHLGMGAFGTT
jgi:CRISPR-associated protein Csb2